MDAIDIKFDDEEYKDPLGEGVITPKSKAKKKNTPPQEGDSEVTFDDNLPWATKARIANQSERFPKTVKISHPKAVFFNLPADSKIYNEFLVGCGMEDPAKVYKVIANMPVDGGWILWIEFNDILYKQIPLET